jgi:hypothetical protein
MYLIHVSGSHKVKEKERKEGILRFRPGLLACSFYACQIQLRTLSCIEFQRNNRFFDECISQIFHGP